jgi:NitT/TauT family transport system substrate-binding protein
MRTTTRRDFMRLAATAAALSTTANSAFAEDRVIKVGTLKLIHGITPYFYEKFLAPGFKVEVIPFESPTDGKNAVATGTVDFGIYGLAAATLGGANGEPVVVIAAACNRGMAVVAAKDSAINSIKDLKDKKVAIWPGSTQEVVILDRLTAEGMTIKDVQPIRISFSDMAPALARGDIDAYVGAEPGPGISLANGVGKIVEYPYSTPTGSLNMVLTTRREMIEKDPELIRTLLKQGQRICHGRPRRLCRHGDAKARAAEGLDRTGGTERRADLEHRRPVPETGQLLRRADAGQEADPPTAGLHDLHRPQFRESHCRILNRA